MKKKFAIIDIKKDKVTILQIDGNIAEQKIITIKDAHLSKHINGGDEANPFIRHDNKLFLLTDSPAFAGILPCGIEVHGRNNRGEFIATYEVKNGEIRIAPSYAYQEAEEEVTPASEPESDLEVAPQIPVSTKIISGSWMADKADTLKRIANIRKVPDFEDRENFPPLSKLPPSSPTTSKPPVRKASRGPITEQFPPLSSSGAIPVLGIPKLKNTTSPSNFGDFIDNKTKEMLRKSLTSLSPKPVAISPPTTVTPPTPVITPPPITIGEDEGWTKVIANKYKEKKQIDDAKLNIENAKLNQEKAKKRVEMQEAETIKKFDDARKPKRHSPKKLAFSPKIGSSNKGKKWLI